jgi:predicted metal-dependent enzyme (double-stranded beta helix superfamily)
MINLEALKQFKDSHYTRHLVFKSSNVEILVVCWRPGQGSPIHGHGPSDGLMLILEGEIVNTSYCQDGKKITTVWRAGDVGHTPVGDRHEVKNTSDQDVVSLHIYAPPLNRELQGADMGYHNDIIPKEVTLPNDVARYFLGTACNKVPLGLIDPGL